MTRSDGAYIQEFTFYQRRHYKVVMPSQNRIGSLSQFIYFWIKISDKSLTQRFDVSMTSLSSGENKI